MKKTRTSFAKARKTISGFIAAIMLLSLTACGNTEDQLEAPSTDATTEVTTVSETTTTEPTTTSMTTTSTTTEVTTTEQTTTESTTTTTKKTTTTTEPVTTTTTTTTQQPVTTTTAQPTTTTVTTTMPNGDAQGGGGRNNAVTTTKATTTKGEEERPSEVPQDVNPGQWHEDPGITAEDLKAAAEAAFAKVKKTATDYGWTISKTFVNRSTDTQYGIFFSLENPQGPDGEQWYLEYILKAENKGGKAIITANQQDFGTPVGSTNYDDYNYSEDIDSLIKFLKS